MRVILSGGWHRDWMRGWKRSFEGGAVRGEWLQHGQGRSHLIVERSSIRQGVFFMSGCNDARMQGRMGQTRNE